MPVTAGDAPRNMLQQVFETAGLELSEQDMAAVADLHALLSDQRSRLSGAARPETEPMTVPAFEHAWREREARHEQPGE